MRERPGIERLILLVALAGAFLFLEAQVEGITHLTHDAQIIQLRADASLQAVTERLERARSRVDGTEQHLSRVDVDLASALSEAIRSGCAAREADEKAAAAKKDIAALSGEVGALQKQVSLLRGGLEWSARISLLNAQRVTRVERVSLPDPQRTAEAILLPSVQVRGNGGVGGGTIVYSRADATGAVHTYVLTAHHVITKIVKRKDGIETRETADVDLYDQPSPRSLKADLVSYDETRDLALLKLRDDHAYAHVARLVPKEKVAGLQVFTPVFAVGCPLGHAPLPTPGAISSKKKEVKGQNFWMMNAPTIFGNSGGGIFLAETHEMIGVSSMICVYDNLMSTPVPHLGVMVSMDTVYEWLDSQCFQFVYDPSVSRDACERRREEKRKEHPELVQATWDD